MNYQKMNLEICKAMYTSDRRVGYEMSEDRYFVTMNGYYGFIIPNKEVIFKKDRITELDRQLFNEAEILNPENEIKPTEHFIKSGKKFIQKFTGTANGEKWEAWLDSSFLKILANEWSIHYYQRFKDGKPDPHGLILAAEWHQSKEKKELEPKPVMLLLPIRKRDDDK